MSVGWHESEGGRKRDAARKRKKKRREKAIVAVNGIEAVAGEELYRESCR